MRVAFFSPLPPAKSGIADYSATLIQHLAPLCELTTFNETRASFTPAAFDVCLYQIGNNQYHQVAYHTALEVPGVAVVHEANLHHLLCDLTIRNNNWDAYVDEIGYDSGSAARDFAERVRRLEVGPDYDGVPVLRRLAERSRGLIAHSEYVRRRLAQYSNAPSTVIPHGAALIHPRTNEFRLRLDIPIGAPLVGTFGFIKPYKRIAESLRAFKRVSKIIPDAHFLMVGEEHPELPLDPLIKGLGLTGKVTHIGFAAGDEFDGYIGACDVVLNLRWPTVGETSGTLMRSAGMGRAIITSDVGSFAEVPDDACLKVPIGGAEEELLFEYMMLLLSRPELARAMGERARAWVANECNWPLAARRYRDFLEEVVTGHKPAPVVVEVVEPPPTVAPFDLASYLRSWPSATEESAQYREQHMQRFVRTLELTPRGTATDRVLEMGIYFQMTPALTEVLGYGYVEGCYFGASGKQQVKSITHPGDGRTISAVVKQFNAENEVFPYEDGLFQTVLCCELFEHLDKDPMHCLTEINRILSPGGHLVLTTPNAASAQAIHALLLGGHPGFFAAFMNPQGKADDPRHAREYTPDELHHAVTAAGFEVVALETCEFSYDQPTHLTWVYQLLERYQLPRHLRGQDTIIVARKIGPVVDRYPGWLYV